MDTSAKARILLVEDDFKLAALVKEFLETKGFSVFVEPCGDKAVDRILDENPDLVILDIMLPGMDGLAVCRRVRPQYPGPVMMLTALSDDVDEIVGLEIGADEYVSKPVKPRLLLARIENLLRRTNSRSPGTDSPDDEPVEACDLKIDPKSRSVEKKGEIIELTTAEFDLLHYLAERKGQVIERDTIYRDIRGIEWDGLDRSIDLRIARLRRKIGDDARHPECIKSVRGSGYLMVDNERD